MKRESDVPRFYTPQEVGNMTGFSASFIRGEIKSGELEAVYVKPPGRKLGRWMVSVTSAVAYAQKLGLQERIAHG